MAFSTIFPLNYRPVSTYGIFCFSVFHKFILYIGDKSVLLPLSSQYVYMTRRVWRYQRSNQNPFIQEEQTTQWPKEKPQKDKQRSTKHTYKTKDRVTRTPLKTGGELRCSGRVNISCSTSGTRRVNLVTNPVISREWGKDREVEHIRGHLWQRYSIAVNQSHGGDR
jgi:hypothetical protein